MKNIYLGGKTALDVLLSPQMKSLDHDFEFSRMVSRNSNNMMAYLDGLMDLPPLECLPNEAPAISHKEAAQLAASLGATLPLAINVENRSSRRQSSTLHCALHPASAPAGSYIPLGDNLYCASPALALLQEAHAASNIELIVLMSLLFGVFTHSDSAEHPLAPRRKLLDKASLRKFAQECTTSGGRCPKGLERIMTLMDYAVENAASPKEIESALRLGLPVSMGGCNYSSLKMNYPLAVPHSSRTRYCDLYWPAENVAVEYDSELEHTSTEALEADVLHRNDLAALKVTCFYLSAEQLKKFSLFTRTAKQIGAALEAPKLPESAVFRDKQRTLASDIDAAFKRYGF